jgi:hypothetical protein
VSDKPTDRDLDVTVPGKPNAVVRDRPSLPPARYVAGDEIARGGMGRVALATDTLLERTVAVKQALTLDPEMLRRFARETKITARLEHPSIVPVYDAGTDGDAPFYVMRRVSGQPLSELILVSSSFEARIALVPNLLAAAQAVAHAHARGIVHRDIKPANILVGTLGETVVIDWGLAKVVDEPDDDDPIEQAAGDSLRTRVGTVFGTPGFMSPKQLRGEAVGYAADVYALGASLYFLLSGKPPHHAPTGEAMMELAAEGPPMPLAELVPGVPRELAAIVDTALAYGDRRYLDASAFAEDLRRFSTGQLVAAHHYSSRERLVRFLRKHRAAVAIGMIALAVIAVGATLSFQRVLAERDRADAEAAEAVAAREQERERADQLTLIRARMLVDTNPTEAIALLKDIDPTSRRLAEAHGLASAAMMRGVPWGMPPPGTATAIVELSPDGERLLQTTIAGELFVWDLTKRTLVLKRDFGKGFGLRGIWLGNRILVHGRVVPALLDPDTDTLQPVDLPKVHQILVSNDQTFNVALDGTGAVLFDRDGKVTGRPWPGHQVKGAAVTGNGAYLALVSDREMVVLSRDGKEVATRTGKLGLVYASRTNRIAIRDDLDIWELELGPTPKWTKLETSMFHKIVMSLAYRGDELLVAMASGHILALRAGKLFELERVSGTMAFLSEAGQGDFLYALGQSQLLHLHDGGHRRIPLPQVMLSPRIAARPGVDRFVVASNEVTLIYDLATLRPRKLPIPADVHAEFYDEHTLIVSAEQSSWFDLDTGKAIAIQPPMPGISRNLVVSREAGKVVHIVWRGETTELYEVRAGSPDARLIYSGPPVGAVEILDDGTVVYARNRTLSVVGTPDRALITLATPLASLVSRRSDFVIASTGGELVRGTVAGVVERLQLSRPDDTLNFAPTGRPIPPHLDVTPTGDILVGWGTTVWKWTDRLEPVLTVGATLSDLRAIGDGVLVLMPNRRGVIADLETRQLHELPVLTNEVVFSAWKRRALAFDVSGSYHFVELSTFTTWPSTARHWSIKPPALSESGRSLITRTKDELVRWTIPLGTGPIRPRLDLATNATINREGLLTWPWLQR